MGFIQILIILFALFAFSRVVLRARDRAITRNEFVFWSLVWCSVIFTAMIPGIASFFANLLGVQRGTDVFIYIGLVALFYLIFRLYVVLESNEKKLTNLVREIALNKK